MHAAAYEFVRSHATVEPVKVLECGGRDVNGTVRGLFPNAAWVSVDIEPGPGVDVVADFANYTHPELVDVVVSTEVLEHTKRWRDIVASCARNLRPGGRVILTAATHGRLPHSAVDGGPVTNGEHYENIDPDDLSQEMVRWFAPTITRHGRWMSVPRLVRVLGTDVQAVGVR